MNTVDFAKKFEEFGFEVINVTDDRSYNYFSIYHPESKNIIYFEKNKWSDDYNASVCYVANRKTGNKRRIYDHVYDVNQESCNNMIVLCNHEIIRYKERKVNIEKYKLLYGY